MSEWWQRKLGVPSEGPERPPQRPQTASQGPSTPEPSQSLSEGLSASQSEGTSAQRAASGKCPKCGSGNYWEIKSGNALLQGATVPRCFDCGTTMHEQYGSVMGTGGTAQATNPGGAPVVGEARQPKGFYQGAQTDQIVGRL